MCYSYGGWMPDDWCTEAKCTFGPKGCSVRSWTYSYNAVLESLTVAFIAGTFLYGLSVGVSGRKMCRRNVLTIVFFCTLGAVLAHGLWHGAVFAATVVPSGTELPMLLIQKPVAIPMFTIFSVRTIVLLYGGECGHSGGGTVVHSMSSGRYMLIEEGNRYRVLCLTLNLPFGLHVLHHTHLFQMFAIFSFPLM
jgi:hypothetical protein